MYFSVPQPASSLRFVENRFAFTLNQATELHLHYPHVDYQVAFKSIPTSYPTVPLPRVRQPSFSLQHVSGQKLTKMSVSDHAGPCVGVDIGEEGLRRRPRDIPDRSLAMNPSFNRSSHLVFVFSSQSRFIFLPFYCLSLTAENPISFSSLTRLNCLALFNHLLINHLVWR
jgi:hypothetical protein